MVNPKAIKYMQSVFSLKDNITKKEMREIVALYGVTVTQVGVLVLLLMPYGVRFLFRVQCVFLL